MSTWMKQRVDELEAQLAARDAQIAAMREVCQAMLDYEETMDGSDDSSGNDTEYFAAIKRIRALLSVAPPAHSEEES